MSSINGHTPGQPFDLEELRKKLSAATGPKYWRSLEAIAETDEFKKLLDDEFPDRTPDFLDPDGRRNFLKIMGASLALAGLSACTKQPKETIVPYVRQPEEFIPGKPLFYATAMQMDGIGVGLLVESHLGRPTKVEGNPDHPGSLGATTYFHQASLLTMYDPDRSQVTINRGRMSSWVNFQAALNTERERANLDSGAGFRLLTPVVTSPTLAAQIKDFQTQLPGAKWYQWDPAVAHGAFGGAQSSLGRQVNTIYRFDQADVIVSLDADFLAAAPGNIRHIYDYANRRRILTNVTAPEIPKEDRQEGYQPGPAAPFRNQAAEHSQHDPSPPQSYTSAYAEGKPLDQTSLPRLYVFEPSPTPTGGMADHRWAVRAGEIEGIAAELAAALGAGGAYTGAPGRAEIAAIAKDLKAAGGRAVVVPGPFQPASVHALAHAMNAALGSVGTAVVYTEPIEANPTDQIAGLRELIADMNSGAAQTLVMMGVNPVYTAPADLHFADALQKVKIRFHLGLYADETAELCHWHQPEAHYLESWSDTRAYDGTVSLIQPLIAPLYNGKTMHEMLTILTGQADQASHDTLRNYWSTQMAGDFETAFPMALHNGIVPNTAAAAITAAGKSGGGVTVTPRTLNGIEVVVRPDPTIWDGAFSNNGWMQECPKPESSMSWDNAVWISPATAGRLGITTGDDVHVLVNGAAITGGAWIMPGQANDCVTLHLGYGREHCGKVSENIGFNAYRLRFADHMAAIDGAELRKTGGRHYFAAVQHTQTMEEREPVRVATLEEYKKEPNFVNHEEKPIEKFMTLYPDYKYEGYKWGMTIDLNACTGCGSCVVACQAENNIAVVGQAEVAKGRHMHWIRVDRYFKGSLDDPEVYHQPVPCMQCENAPCELVCPVAATIHSGDGINQMVYNRCVGTRYCSNNCPYKVRRFNFLRYSDWETQSYYPMRNPDVTVRSRGVMEKCTYCIQRINAAKIESEKQNRRILDGEVVPACGEACPARAIVFGDINDPKSQVAKLKVQTRNYSLLEELNTRPRTTYLARVRNPNPELNTANTAGVPALPAQRG